MPSATPTDFPCSITINTPFPTPRLAYIALRALSVDAELSPLVQRSFSLSSIPDHVKQDAPDPAKSMKVSPLTGGILRLGPDHFQSQSQTPNEAKSVLVTTYSATANRMLRVSVNGFFESLGVVLGCMRELDGEEGWEGQWIGEEGTGKGTDVGELRRVQGLSESGVVGAP